jgi:hypothetical protein
MPLLKRRSPFDDPNWIFDGHEMSYVGDGRAFSRLLMMQAGSELKCHIKSPS